MLVLVFCPDCGWIFFFINTVQLLDLPAKSLGHTNDHFMQLESSLYWILQVCYMLSYKPFDWKWTSTLSHFKATLRKILNCPPTLNPRKTLWPLKWQSQSCRTLGLKIIKKRIRWQNGQMYLGVGGIFLTLHVKNITVN